MRNIEFNAFWRGEKILDTTYHIVRGEELICTTVRLAWDNDDEEEHEIMWLWKDDDLIVIINDEKIIKTKKVSHRTTKQWEVAAKDEGGKKNWYRLDDDPGMCYCYSTRRIHSNAPFQSNAKPVG